MQEPKVELTVSEYNILTQTLKVAEDLEKEAREQLNAQKEVREKFEKTVFLAATDMVEKLWEAYLNELNIDEGKVEFNNPFYNYTNWYESKLNVQNIDVNITMTANKHRTYLHAYFTRKLKAKDA